MILGRTLPITALCCLSFACSSGSDDDVARGNEPAMPGTGQPSEPVEPDGEGPAAGPCEIASGYPGDDFCIAPPDANEGIQLWVGPTDYDDPDAVRPYLLEPGGEDVICFHTEPVAGDFHYLKQSNRMRSGSHHMLINLKASEGRSAGPVVDQGDCEGFAGILGTVPGSQMPMVDFTTSGFGPEDAGLGRYFPADAIASFQMHYVNTGTETVMREAWVNLYFKDEVEVTDPLNSVFLVGDLAVDVPAGARQTTPLRFEPTLEQPTRIFELTGHSHAHSERFSVWTNRGTEQERLVYESYDWAEPDVLRYNTVVDNAPPDPVAFRDGGISGLFHIEPGDTLDFECEVNNTSDLPLRFANEAYTAEMCLLAGSYVGQTSGLFVGGCASGTCSGAGSFLSR
jgi:hypothetical protein